MDLRLPIAAPAALLLALAGCEPAATTSGGPDGGQGQDAGNPGGNADAGDADAGNDGGTEPTEVTWYRDVLPIVQGNCQGCHAPGGIAPFPLVSFADAFPRHPTIAGAVSSRMMPPWMPDDACIPLKHSRRLSQAEIDLIVRWSDEGAVAGDPADAPDAPPPPPGLPRVDATLDPGADYVPKSNVLDDYRCFILPPAMTAQTDVIGMDVVPGTRQQVHHVILFGVPAAEAQQKDDGEAGLGWTCYGGPGVAATSVKMIGGWVPGSGAAVFPPDTGIRLAPGEVVVMQVHYNLAGGPPVADRTQAKLMYATSPVPKEARLFPVAAQNFSIPPNSQGTSAKASFTIPPFFQATIYGITPHMHQLGRTIRARNVTNGQCLIDIPNWDFHWQQPYEYAEPVTLTAGQTVEVECVWDNPTAATVTWGEGTADEMCVAFFYATFP